MWHSIAMHAPHERRRGRAIAQRVQQRFAAQAVSRRWFSCLCAILFVCVSGGCVLTETRISDPEAATVGKDFLGDWVSADDTPKHLRITTTDAGHLPKGFMRSEQIAAGQEPLVAYLWTTQVGKKTFASIPVVIKDGLRPVDCSKEEEYRAWRDDPHAKSLLLIITATNDKLLMHEGESVRLLGTREAILEKLERDPADLFSKEPAVFVRSTRPSPNSALPLASRQATTSRRDLKEPAGANAATAESLVPSDAKALVRVNVGGVVRSDVGKANLRAMLESPSGQQAVLQLAGFQAKYGFNYLTDLQTVTLMAPVPGGELFNGVLLVAEGAFQRRRIELVLANVDKMPHEKYAEVTVYEQTGQGGGGRFFFAFLSDSVFIASMDRPTVCAAIDRAVKAPEEMPAVLAAATSHLPADSSISLVMDVSAFNKNGAEWQDFKNRTNWWSLSVDMGASKTITAMLEGKTPDDAQAMRDRVVKMFSPDGAGRQAFQVIPLPFQPDYGTVDVSQAGRVVVVKAKGLR